MKKQNELIGDPLKPLFEPPPGVQASYLKVNGGGTSVTIEVPTALMHRLYRLGQAYGIRQLRYFESMVKLIVGTTEVPELVSDLHRLRGLVNDMELDQYLERLLAALEGPPGIAGKSIVVSCGDYFDRRAPANSMDRTR